MTGVATIAKEKGILDVHIKILAAGKVMHINFISGNLVIISCQKKLVAHSV